MTLSDFERGNGKYFIAMQYYWLIFNRTYLVLLTDSALVGIQANGLVADKAKDGIVRAIFRKLEISGDLQDPRSYVKEKFLKRAGDLDLRGDELLAENKLNFRVNYHDIVEIKYDPKKKWGMGQYPHDGKVYVKARNGKTMEFIILGSQSGSAIKDLIARKMST
jgi:hypothetical protein